MGIGGLTEQAIARTRLPANPSSDQVVTWINSVAPCLKLGGTQSESDTALIIDALRYSARLRDEAIGAALLKTGYKWTVPMRDMRIAFAMRSDELESARRNPPQTSMGPRGKPDREAIRLQAQRLGAIYDANPHNPEVQEKARKDLQSLIYLLNDDGGSDPMPGRGRMESDRDRIAKTQKEILLTAGELGRQISLQLGPLGVHRARGGFMPRPDPPGTPYRPPNLRTPPRR